jgi:hypothetical protein
LGIEVLQAGVQPGFQGFDYGRELGGILLVGQQRDLVILAQGGQNAFFEVLNLLAC